MSSSRQDKSFTLIELLVVISIIGLLVSILLPSLSRARERSKIAVCLSNMRQIGILMLAYADEDSASQPIPIHMMMMRPTGRHWLWRTANSFTWGGRDGQRPLVKGDSPSDDDIWLSGDERGYVPPGLDFPAYGAVHRPLNRYMLASVFTDIDRDDLPIFQCPSDVGYPTAFASGAVPPSTYEVPCYDVFGNSYRANLYAFIDDTGALAMGPWGHRLQTLTDPGRLVLMGEPLFFALAGCAIQPSADWHGRHGTGNVLFVDGGARATDTRGSPAIDKATAELMGLLPGPNRGLIRSGSGWRIDTWPTPGARIWGAEGEWTYPFTAGAISPLLNRDLWPFAGYQRNLD